MARQDVSRGAPNEGHAIAWKRRGVQHALPRASAPMATVVRRMAGRVLLLPSRRRPAFRPFARLAALKVSGPHCPGKYLVHIVHNTVGSFNGCRDSPRADDCGLLASCAENRLPVSPARNQALVVGAEKPSATQPLNHGFHPSTPPRIRRTALLSWNQKNEHGSSCAVGNATAPSGMRRPSILTAACSFESLSVSAAAAVGVAASDPGRRSRRNNLAQPPHHE